MKEEGESRADPRLRGHSRAHWAAADEEALKGRATLTPQDSLSPRAGAPPGGTWRGPRVSSLAVSVSRSPQTKPRARPRQIPCCLSRSAQAPWQSAAGRWLTATRLNFPQSRRREGRERGASWLGEEQGAARGLFYRDTDPTCGLVTSQELTS